MLRPALPFSVATHAPFAVLICLLTTGSKSSAQDQSNSVSDSSTRREWILTDGWTVERDGTTQPISIVDSWETEGFAAFDGRGVYVRELKRSAFDSETLVQDHSQSGRWILEVGAAATSAVVDLDGEKIGSHLGGWTPFRMDVADWMCDRASRGNKASQLRIEVDELVGHNTQGFLPIVVPHFGGLWKPVRLVQTAGNAYIDDLTLLTAGLNSEGVIRIEAFIRGADNARTSQWEVGVRIREDHSETGSEWVWLPVQALDADQQSSLSPRASGTDSLLGTVRGSITPEKIRRWSPESPYRYPLELQHGPNCRSVGADDSDP